MDKKTDLRAKAKIVRRSLNMDKISVSLTEKLRERSIYKDSENIMLFYPMKYEVNLLSLLKDSKTFYLPKVNSDELIVCPYKFGDKLEKSKFGVLEPCSVPVNPQILDLIIVPALLVDKAGYRLGYGGGFYDRFLSKYCKNKNTVCLMPEVLVVDKLPVDEFDVPVKEIIYV